MNKIERLCLIRRIVNKGIGYSRRNDNYAPFDDSEEKANAANSRSYFSSFAPLTRAEKENLREDVLAMRSRYAIVVWQPEGEWWKGVVS